MTRNIPLERIVAHDSTKSALQLLQEYQRPKPKNHAELEFELKRIIASGEHGLAEVANLHPDKNLLLAIFSEESSGCDGSGGCKCNCNKDKMLNATGPSEPSVAVPPAPAPQPASSEKSNYQLLFGFSLIAMVSVLFLKMK